MKKIFILGIGPISIESTKKFHGGGNRAWHFTKSLIDQGFEVILVCMRITDHNNPNQPDETCLQQENLTYYSVDEINCFANDDYLRNLIAKHQPDALIGCCDYPAARAAFVSGDLPVWADIHGYPMGEAQAKTFHYQESGYLHHFWNIHRIPLLRADHFSVTSERQRMALIGELGAMGRLNQHTFSEELASTIPIAWNPETPYRPRQRQKDDPFVVFFSGGYNLWCDIETLFQALENAMERDSRIRFLSTGGAIEGHDDKTYPRFLELVNQSRFRDRFELKGWVSKEDLEICMNQTHLGISTDLPCYETKIGARNRLTEFMARGIPILTTLGTEISQIIFYKGLAFTVPMQNPIALANEIILAADHPEKLNRMTDEARNYFESQFTYQATTKELVEWCNNPCHSGDFGNPIQLDYSNPFITPTPSTGLRGKLKRLFKP
jgi:glycosyltransferase involved in cell wall biosynthesis